MKSLTKLMAMGLLTVGLVACSSEDENIAQPGQNFGEGDKVFMSLNLSYPQSRAAGNPDIEVGTDAENKVSTVQVILVKDGVVAASTVGSFAPGTSGNVNNKRYTATFNARDLLGLAGKQGVELYAVCNGSVDPLQLVQDKKSLTSVDFSTLASEAYWQQNGFLMTNANGAALVASIPTRDILMTQNSTAATALPLGVVQVERAAARLDYQAAKAQNIYDVVSEEGGQAVAAVDLDEYTVGNISKQFYSFIRTNADGSASNMGTLGKGGSYVVDVDWGTTPAVIQPAVKNPNIDTQEGTYVNYKYKNLDQLSQNDNWQDAGGATRNNYKVMTYLSENTTAKTAEGEKKGYVTAVYFKGHITANAHTPEPLKQAINSKEPLVVYHDMLMGTWAMVKELASKTSADLAGTAFEGKVTEFQAFQTNYQLAQAEAQATPDKKITHQIALRHGFTIYDVAPGTNQHEVYYPYWNQHDAANMTYGVVRNNVYKLQIKNIKKFGYPRQGDIDPDEPVKSNDIFFNLSVDVLPWAVKVNDIEF